MSVVSLGFRRNSKSTNPCDVRFLFVIFHCLANTSTHYHMWTSITLFERKSILNSNIPKGGPFVFLNQLVYDLGLAGGVDGSGEVEHPVVEAPLVEGDTLYLPLLASLARTSRTHCYAPIFQSLSFFRIQFWRTVFSICCRATRDNFFRT